MKLEDILERGYFFFNCNHNKNHLSAINTSISIILNLKLYIHKFSFLMQDFIFSALSI